MSANTRIGFGFASAAFLALLLAACGGGGGGGTAAPNVTFKHVVLTGAQENPAVTTAAVGTGFISVDLDTSAVSGTISTFGLTATAAHIHTGAAGVNGPVIIPLVQGPPGTWMVTPNAVLTSTQREAFAQGNLYVNLHSAANPGGEIRAQVGRQLWFATLTGAQETPGVTTGASGTGRFLFDPDTRTLSGTVTTTGVTGTAAHIHTAAVGVAGPVTFPMTGGPADWTLPPTVLSQEQVQTLVDHRFYANVHSAANPGGEVRGQLFVPARNAQMSGAEEVPPVTTTAAGNCWVSVNPFTKGVAGRIETTGVTGVAAHVHVAPRGTNGPVRIPMTQPTPGVWETGAATIADDVLAAFIKGDTYCNVHSAANPGGQIRGQLNAVIQ